MLFSRTGGAWRVVRLVWDLVMKVIGAFPRFLEVECS